MSIFIAAIVGLVLGILGSKILFVGSFLNLLPWGLVGLATGIYAKTKKEALISGAIYGFVLSFVFILSGYTGSSAISKLPGFIGLGLFGALCGAVLGFLGTFLKRKHP